MPLQVRKYSSSSSRRPRRTDDDTEDYFSGDRSRRSYNSRRKVTSDSRDSVEEILTDDVYSEVEKSSKVKKTKKRRKSKRRDTNERSYTSTADREQSIRDNYSSRSESRRSSRKGILLTYYLRFNVFFSDNNLFVL